MRTQAGFSLRLPAGILRLASAALLLTAIVSTSANADLVFTVESVSAQAGSTDNILEVFLTNNGPSPVTIGGFAFEISAGTGITFTAVDINTNPAYIFAGHSTFGPDISNQPPNLPGNMLAAEDNYNISGSGISLGVGPANSVGLGNVHFDVAPSASGSIAITLMQFPTTNVSDQNHVDITNSNGPASYMDGMVNVTASSTPEPASLVMTSIGLVAGIGYWSSRRRRSGREKSARAGRSRRSVG